MRDRPPLAVIAALVLTLVVIALHVDHHRHAGALWRDEANGVNLATMPSWRALFANAHLDSFPLVWPTVLHAWQGVAGASDGAFRRLGLAIGIASIGVLWWSARALGVSAPLVALLVFAMSPSVIIYGDSVRGYGLAAVAVVFCMGAMWRLVEKPARRTFVIAFLAALVTVHTYFPNGILLAAIGAGAATVCLRRRDRRTLGTVVAIVAAASASLAINLPWITYALGIAPLEQGDWTVGDAVYVLRYALAPGVDLLAALWAIALVAAAAGCVLAWTKAAPESDRERALFVALTTVTAMTGFLVYLVLVARIRPQYWYYLSLMAAVALACEVGTSLLARRFVWGEAVRVTAVAVAALLIAAKVDAAVRMRMTNLDLIASTVARDAQAEDLVVVFPWQFGITFERYYHGRAPWITVPDFDEHRFHLHRLVGEKMKLGSAAVAPELARVERILRSGGKVWIAGVLLAPPSALPGTLPPAPAGARSARYLDDWELQLAALLRAHARDVWSITLPDVGPVNTWENLPLQQAEGWR